MAISVIIDGSTYSIPVQGQNPAWGSDLSDLLVAITNVLNFTVGLSDILLTNFTVANNQASVADITGLSFDSTVVRSAIISYSLYRSTASSELSECGQIYVTYLSTAATWTIAQNFTGLSGVVFSITNAGQVQYTSSNLSGASYVGKLKFTAKSFLQT